MDKTWLVKLWEDVGLEGEAAGRAAEETWRRLVRRERPRALEPASRRSLTEFLVRDPLVSLNRIIGRGDAGLPFFDDDTKALSLIAFGNVLTDSGVDPVVAMAYAKVVVEAYEPADFYGHVWTALGKEGPVELEALRRMDWSPLRANLPPDPAPDTLVTRAQTSASATVVTPTAGATPTTSPPGRPLRAPATGGASGAATVTTPAVGAAMPRRGPAPRPLRPRPMPQPKPKK